MAVSTKKEFSRLPTSVKPVHYNLAVKPDLVKFSFDGTVNIELDVSKSTDVILCNAVDLRIESVSVLVDKDTIVKVESFEVRSEDETLFIRLGTKLEKGKKCQLSISFVGELTDRMKGFYRSRYLENGEVRFAAVTQFEATDARRCFPCWDEPALKATFDITIVAPKDRIAISNMPIVSDKEAEGDPKHKVIKFDRSPIMSTYLLAMIVGEFEYIEAMAKNGRTTIRVYVPMGKKEQGTFALDACVAAMEFYEKYFGIEYPLPKYDCIAVADFESGAMENWGLVVYREHCILVDPKNTSSDGRQWVAIVVTHEMAHQWFGNLVTMEWWTHLWLNEGFASFMENTCTQALYPEFDIWPQFVADTLLKAQELDGLKNSHPIEVEVGHPSEVDEIFDNISYNKGASVIRMLHHYVGGEAFKKGMNKYLLKHSYKNAETGDLWKALSETSGKELGPVMSTWTGQMGFPVIKVQSCKEGESKRVLNLTQEKFCSDGSSAEGYLWKVPITITTEKGIQKNDLLLNSKTMEIILDDPGWFKLNTGFIGYYRVQYTPEDLESLRPTIEKKLLSEVDRLNLLDDLFALVRCGKASTVEALKLIGAFHNETSYVVWNNINSCLAKLAVILKGQEYYESYKKFVVDLMTKIAKEVGWTPKKGEYHVTGLLRSLVIARMGLYGHEETKAEAQRLFADHYRGLTQIPPDLRGSVYRIVMYHGDESTFGQILKLYRENDLSEEKERLASALGVCQRKDILEKVLEFSLSDEVKSQDMPFVLESVARNWVGRDMAWEFFKSHYDQLYGRYHTGYLMQKLVSVCISSFTSLDKAQEVETFFKTYKNYAERTVKQGIENILLNAAWINRDGEKIRKFFESKK